MQPLDPLDVNLDRIRIALRPAHSHERPLAEEPDALEKSPLLQRLMFWRSR